jgi:hypothetical protein
VTLAPGENYRPRDLAGLAAILTGIVLRVGSEEASLAG